MRIKPNLKGNFPSHCNSKKGNTEINTYLETIILNLGKKDKCCFGNIRNNINNVNGYLEMHEGYYYGLSEGFIKNEDKPSIRIEHGIPAKVLIRILNRMQLTSNEELLDFLRSVYSICLVTKEEDKKIDKAGYREKMPDGWNIPDDWRIRYVYSGINLLKSPGREF
jgi:hypothetical protein